MDVWDYQPKTLPDACKAPTLRAAAFEETIERTYETPMSTGG
jgi:hypothetical protein